MKTLGAKSALGRVAVKFVFAVVLLAGALILARNTLA